MYALNLHKKDVDNTENPLGSHSIHNNEANNGGIKNTKHTTMRLLHCLCVLWFVYFLVGLG